MATPDLDPHDDRAARSDRAQGSRPLAPGTSVGGWLVVGALREEIDQVLYAATRGSGGPPACLKLIDLSPLHDTVYLRHFRRATRRWKRLDNPHLARLAEAGSSPAGPFLATALFVGPSLAAKLEEGPLDAADASRLGAEVASALDAALDADLIPGAVTPRDITLTSAGALVTDPGVGRGPAREPVDAVEGVHYVSPEEARGEPQVAQSAVYSLACVMHECLTGVVPYPRDLPQAVLYAHVAETPPRPSKHNASLPVAVDTVFERAMAAAPERRHPSPGNFARELSDALGGVAPAHAPVRVEERPPGPAVAPSRGRVWALVAATAACAAAGFALGSAGDSDETPAPQPRAAPGPPATARAAQTIVDELDGRRSRLREGLANARTRARQAAAARRLARLHARAAQGAQDATPEVQRALDDARRAYARLAAAATARRGERRAWAAGRAETRRADAALNRELSRSAG